VTLDELISDIKDLAKAWRSEASDLKRNGLPESASTLFQCKDELLALVRRAKREVKS